jgi:hypothetical protein
VFKRSFYTKINVIRAAIVIKTMIKANRLSLSNVGFLGSGLLVFERGIEGSSF